MSTSEVLAVVAAIVVAMFVGGLAVALVALTRTLRVLRTTVEALRDETLPLANDLRDAARDASYEVERVDRLVTSAERLENAVDSASHLAYRTFANPVVKAMALGTGVSRAANRLRGTDGAADGTNTTNTGTPELDRDRRRRSRRAS
jgi:hypothetical protein